MRISHRDDVDGSIRKGRDLECVVLDRAVHFHLEDRVLFFGNKLRSSTERYRSRRPQPEGTDRIARDRTVTPGRLHSGACRLPLA
jgi:hypothetical protein